MADLLQVAGLARSTFYYQCQAAQCADQQSAMEARIRTVYDEHKGRYGYRRITAALCNSMAQPVSSASRLATVDDYLREADNAMYQAKSESLGVCVVQAMESE